MRSGGPQPQLGHDDSISTKPPALHRPRRQKKSTQQQCQTPKGNDGVCGKPSRGIYCSSCLRKKRPLQECKMCGKLCQGRNYCSSCRKKKSRSVSGGPQGDGSAQG